MRTNNSTAFSGIIKKLTRWVRVPLLALLGTGAMLQAHNLDTISTSLQFAKDYIATMATRAAVKEPLIRVGDEFWVVAENTPGPGTATGVGGYATFYLPAGYQVVDAAYVLPSSTDPRGFVPTAIKGQSTIAIGAGTMGAKVAIGLTGFRYPSANILGINEDPVTAAGISRGTVAGVYADTGIFYSTDPRTVFNSYGTPVGGLSTVKNNSGDIVGEWFAISQVPNKLGVMTRWDFDQLQAFGRKDVAPIIDPADGRGNAPWGMASAVAGPQSGYQWAFNFQKYTDTAGTLSQKIQTGIEVGPWNRLRYPGSQISKDQAGSASTVLGYAGVPAGTIGYDFTASGPLPTTVNAVRFAIGQLELGRSEHTALKVRLLPNFDAAKPLVADAFGGDAGGLSIGKDHLWRYFDPTISILTPSVTLQKTVANPLLAPNEFTYFDITFINTGVTALTNVTLVDTLPSGLAYDTTRPATPAPASVVGAKVTWNLGTVLPGELRTFRLNVKALTTGTWINHVDVFSNGTLLATAEESVEVGVHSLLRADKTVTPSVTIPGSTVRYTITVFNEGNGSNGVPLKVADFLSPGFTFKSLVGATLNGGVITLPSTNLTVNSTVPGSPVFTVAQSILPGKTLTITFDANVGTGVLPGTYYNLVQLEYESKIIPPVPLAPVTIGGGQIGDIVYRDWNSNGIQDAGEEGLPGVVLKLYAADGTTELSTTTTGAGGKYLFEGLYSLTFPAGYVVKVSSGVPAGYVLTGDPDTTLDGNHSVSLQKDEVYLNADFGYRPGGTASISSNVYEDVNNNAAYGAGDKNIPNATVRLTTSAGNLVATTKTNTSGIYLFSNLAGGLDYKVVIDGTASNADVSNYFAPDPFVITTPATYTITNLTGSSSPLGFGFFRNRPATLGGTVFEDTDRNGNYITGTDAILPNVTVNLYNDVNANGLYDKGTDTLQATTASAPDGTYLFTMLAPGSYLSVVDSADTDVPVNLIPSVGLRAKTLVANEDYLTADFPFVGALLKTADKDFAATGQAITFNLQPSYTTSGLFTNLRVLDPVPSGTTYVDGSATASGGSYSASYVPLAAAPGSSGTAPAQVWNTALSVSSNSNKVGDILTVTLNVRSSVAVAALTPSTLTAASGSSGTFTILTSPSAASVAAGGSGTNFSWTVSLDEVGEYAFVASSGQTVWPSAKSASVLAVNSGGPGVVSWNLGTNTAPVPSTTNTSIGTATPGIYGLRGASTGTFAISNLSSPNAWTARATAPSIGAGGAMTTDSVQTIYALAGNTTANFAKYDVISNVWTTLPNFPSTVAAGGALCYLEVAGVKYVYGMAGNSTTTFRRYNIATQTWTSMAVMPVAVKAGGSLTTDGTYIYALVGGSTGFYRYDPASNTWLARAATIAPAGDGASLTRIGNFLYALMGNNGTAFHRYDIAANTWITRAVAPGNVKQGGALTTDGTSIYAFRGNSQAAFWRYNPGSNTWTVLTNYSATVGAGGSLVYVPQGVQTTRSNAMSAATTLASTGDQITVSMRLSSATAVNTSNFVNNIRPGSVSITATGGASATLVSGPTLSSLDDDLTTGTDVVVYNWVYSATAGAAPGSLIFSATAAGDATTAFNAASSNSVLVTPSLSFQAKVAFPGPAGGFVTNTGILLENGFVLPHPVPSNPTLTATSASIGEYVWFDADQDGIHDEDEVGIANVTVNVFESDGITLLRQTTTDTYGKYRVCGLQPASYVVRTDIDSYPSGWSWIMTTPNEFSVTLVAGEQNKTVNFGAYGASNPALSSIGDQVWIDADADGVFDDGETPIANITVSLQRLNAGDWTVVASTTTNSSGKYEFNSLISGTYKVVIDSSSVVANPNQASFTGTLGLAMEPTYDRDGIATPHEAIVDITSGQLVVVDADFGYQWAGKIGDFAWYDTNGNGVQDETNFSGGPQPAADCTVFLWLDTDGSGLIEATDASYGARTTGNDGIYLFDHLPPGNYIAHGSSESVKSPVSGVPGSMLISKGGKRPVVLGTGLGQSMAVLTTDFGLIEAAVVEGNVFHDVNSNGYLDPTEPPLVGINVYAQGSGPDAIFGTPDDLMATIITASNGSYKFYLLAGDYRLNYNTTQIPATLSKVTTTLEYEISVIAGEERKKLDFGRDNAGIIGGTIFRDVAPRDVYGPEDTGISGVVVGLYSDASYTTLVTTTLTNASGLYSFDGIADGDSYVKVDTATLRPGTDTTPTVDPESPMDSRAKVTIVGGGSSLQNNFGYVTPTGTIGGRVFKDIAPVGGSFGAEDIGISNVTVGLYSDSGFTTQITSTTTDSEGLYSFPDIIGGTYYVKVNTGTLPPNTPIPPTVDPDTLKDSQTTVVLSNGASSPNNNFGYHTPAGVISGTIFRDTPVVRTFETTDVKLSGITVGLYSDAAYSNVISAVITGVDGKYSFTALADGTYYVKVITADLPNDVITTPTVDPDVTPDSRTSVTITADSTSANNNFGYQNKGVIAGTIFRDTPVINTFEASDVRLSGISVGLFSDSSFTTQISSKITDASGEYSFTDLTNGTYYVKVVTTGLPNDVIITPPTYDPDSTSDSETKVVISSGGSSLNNHFGYKSKAAPEIVVENPPGGGLTDNSGQVDLGTSNLCYSSSSTFTVRNDGNSGLTISGITIDGTNASNFAIATELTYPIVLAPAGTRQFTVIFSAQLNGDYAADMHILSDDADEASFDIHMVGTGYNRFLFTNVPALKNSVLVPVQDADYTAIGQHFKVTLGFAPVAGDQFTVLAVDPGHWIIGTFNDLPQGGVVALGYQGNIYYFQANYSGGDGNDLVLTNFTPAVNPAWTYLYGSPVRNGLAMYPVAPATNGTPGGRQGGMHFKRPNGNMLAFGGFGYTDKYLTTESNQDYLNELWEYDRNSNSWNFIKGSKTPNQLGNFGIKGEPNDSNCPGGRHSGGAWDGCDDNLWVFGGVGPQFAGSRTPAVRYNDLWMFNYSTQQWTWKSGSQTGGAVGVYGTKDVADPANTPGARGQMVTWTGDCAIWLFGGTKDGGNTFFNDLWKYDVYTGMWTWMAGPNTDSGQNLTNAYGAYGVQGTGSVNNTPGARRNAIGWTTPGKFWLFGGSGYGASGSVGDLNDVWYYEESTGKWTWVKGATSTGATYVIDSGNPANNTPTARSAGSGWATANGKFCMYGGIGNIGAGVTTYGQFMSDMWTFDTQNYQWAYVRGSLTGDSSVVGTSDDHPGSRWAPGTMLGLDGSQWFFGGGGFGTTNATGRLNDLWRFNYVPAPVAGAAKVIASAPGKPFADEFPFGNILPTSQNTTASTTMSTAISGTLAATDAEGDVTVFSNTTDMTGKSNNCPLNLQSNGQWTYTPAVGFVGTDTFTFKVDDCFGGSGTNYTLSITVNYPVTMSATDGDKDGMADGYETFVWGNNKKKGTEDFDLDGQTNYYEYLAGTSPVDALQKLIASTSTTIGASGSPDITLNYVRPGVNYTLESSSDQVSWTPIATYTFGASGSASIANPTPGGTVKSYRITLAPQ